MGKKIIFEHDAVPTWSGFLYQGRIAVYLAVKKIIELKEAGKESEVEKYTVEMEKCEDIALVYVDGDNRQYHSIHQVKNEKKSRIGAYKDPLTQLMLEKGFCQKLGYGTPDAYLHISTKIDTGSQSTDECISVRTREWKNDILKFYNELLEISTEFAGDKEALKQLIDIMERNINTIGINRKIYKTKYADFKKICIDELSKSDKESIEAQKIKEGLDDIIKFLEDEFYVSEVSSEVKVYEYEAGKNYCTGPEVFSAIVSLVRQYKGAGCCFIKEQFEYIADKLIISVESLILERHKKMRKDVSASCEIELCSFKNILDETIENYEKEANILALKRLYNEHMESFCNICHRKNNESCPNISCKLQQSEYRKGILESDEFTKFCYNLSPECDKEIEDRICLNFLLNSDGMKESVFPIIKEIEEKYFVEKEDDIHIKVRNQDKVAFVTAITNAEEMEMVEKIAKAMKKHSELIENIFEADQLVTTRLNKSSDVWDLSCIRVKPDDIDEEEFKKVDNGNSIFVPKRPELVKAEDVIKNMEKKA